MIWLKLEKMVINIKDEYIKLNQLMKLCGFVGRGSDVKLLVDDGLITLNGQVVTELRKKIHPGDSFEYKGTVVTVE